MQTLVSWLASDGWFRLVQTLGHSLWQGGIIACLLWLALRRLPARRVEARYAVSLGALAALVLCAVITGTTLETRTQISARLASAKPELPVDSPRIAAQATQGTAGGQATSTTKVLPKTTSLTMSTPATSSADPARDLSTPAWVPWVALGWLAGCGLMTLRFLRQWLGARWLVARCRVVEDAHLLALVARLRDVLGLRQAVRVLCGEHISGPCVFGLITPKLLLPPALLLGVPVEQLEAILAHELAHIRRRDIWVSLAQQIVEIVFFFNPAMWWISRQLRIEREAGCDSLAVVATGKRDDYARALEAWARQQAASALAPAFSDGPHPAGPLERLKRLLLAGYQPPVRLPWPSLCGTALLTALLILGVLQGTRLASTLAAEILTPAQRVEKLAEIKEKYGQPTNIDPTDENGAKVVLKGTVEDESGELIDGSFFVNIESRSGRSSRGKTISGEHGRFRAECPAGMISLHIYREGYAEAWVKPFKLNSGERREDLKVVLHRGYSAQVQVVNDQGAAVPGAVVECYYQAASMHVGQKNKKTGPDGMAVFEHLATNAVQLKVTAAGFEYEEKKLSFLSPEAPLIWKLTPALMTTGTVVDARTGEPVAEAIVRLWKAAGVFEKTEAISSDQRFDGLPVLGVTDDKGEFRLDRLNRAMSYALVVDAAGYSPFILSPVQAGQKPQARLEPQIDLRGRLAGDWGKETWVFMSWTIADPFQENCTHGYSWRAPITRRGEEAFFEFINASRGPITLSVGGIKKELVITQSIDDLVLKASAAKPTDEFADAAWREVRLKLQMPAGCPPVSGPFKYGFWLDATHRGYSSNATLINGEARLRIPVPGGVTIESGALASCWLEPLRQEVPAGTDLFELVVPTVPSGGIFGEVQDSDGSALGGVMVSVVQVAKSPLRQSEGSLGVEVKNSSSPNDGPTQYSAQPLPLGGKYLLVAHKGEAYVASPPVTLTEAQPVRECSFRLAPGVTVAGQVCDAEGKPLPNARVSLELTLTKYSHSFGGSEVGTDREGRFRFERVNPEMPGTYTIDVKPDVKFAPLRAEVDFKRLPLQLTLAKSVSVWGKVLDAAGKPIPFAEVTAHPKAQPGYHKTQADEHGRFQLDGLAQQPYDLCARVPGMPVVTATGGQEKPVILRKQEGY